MHRSLCPTLVLLAALLALAASQGFYSQRYGKRSDTRQMQVRSGFYANRYGRSQGQSLPEIKVRSSRFVGGSRYGKRATNIQTDIPTQHIEGEDSDMPASMMVGDSVLCLMVELPDVYRCIRKATTSEESTN